MNLHASVSSPVRNWLSSALVPAAIVLLASSAPAAESGYQCDLVVAVQSSTTALGSMQFRLGYGATSGWIAGHGNEPDCEFLVDDELFAFWDNENEKALRAGLVSIDGVAVPTDLVSCVFRGSSIPDPGDFELAVEDAADPDNEPVVPTPTLEVTVANCQPIDSLTTTTSTTTTTTLPVCGNWAVLLAIESAAKPVRTLQVEVAYQNTNGQFPRDQSIASCESLVDAVSVEGKSFVNPGVLYVSTNGVGGIPSGVDYASCLFSGNWTNPPAVGDFTATVTRAVSTDNVFVSVDVALSLAAVTEPEECENRCGDGVVEAPAEECDDANDTNQDSCPQTCEAAECGDGYVRAGVEACDDGNVFHTDDCLVDCTLPRCGDHHVHNGVEECDDGNSNDTDVCRNNCLYAQCGDGVVHDGDEECDDGGIVADDGCSANCRIERVCGDPVAGGGITTSDALRILRSAVGLDVECLPLVCDVNNSGSITVIDALTVLRLSVGLETTLHCPETPA